MWPKAFAIFSKHVHELARILACSEKELAFAALFPKRHPDQALYAIGKAARSSSAMSSTEAARYESVEVSVFTGKESKAFRKKLAKAFEDL